MPVPRTRIENVQESIAVHTPLGPEILASDMNKSHLVPWDRQLLHEQNSVLVRYSSVADTSSSDTESENIVAAVAVVQKSDSSIRMNHSDVL